jgi:hypothetical protein
MLLYNKDMRISLKKFTVCPCWVLAIIRFVCVFILSLITLSFVLKYVDKNNEHFVELLQTQQVQPQTTITAPMTQPKLYNFKIVTKDEFTERISLSDFFSSLNSLDVIARSTSDSVVTSGEHYKNIYIASYEDFTDVEKNILSKVVEEANKLLSKHQNLQQLEWKFTKVNEKIENGLPHTMSDMIVLNTKVLKQNEKELVKTIIHEKVHVYQRLNIASCNKWINQTGFVLLSQSDFSTLNKDVLDMRRSNPDLNRNTYYHEKNQLVLKQLYNNKTPYSVLDSKAYGIAQTGGYTPILLTNELLGLPKGVYCQLEHPYEIMACLIADILTNPQYVDEYGNNDFVRSTILWMNQELKHNL